MTHALLSSVRRTATALGLSALITVAGSRAAGAEEGRITLFGRHSSLILGASMYVASDSATRAAFGERSFSPSVGLYNFEAHRGLGVAFDLGGRRMTEDPRRAEFLQAGVGPRYLFTDGSADFAPYVSVRGDAYVVRIDREDWHVKPGVNVELGTSVLRHFVLSGRYDAVPKVDGVDLSGFSARAAVKVF